MPFQAMSFILKGFPVFSSNFLPFQAMSCLLKYDFMSSQVISCRPQAMSCLLLNFTSAQVKLSPLKRFHVCSNNFMSFQVILCLFK
jgi:hypothetical protein